MTTPGPPPLPSRMPKGLKITLWVVGIWAALILLGKLSPTSSSSSSSSSSLPVTTTAAAEDGAALAARDAARERILRQSDPEICLSPPSYKAVAEEYVTYITGTIKNTCGRSFSYVQVTFKLFDGSGAVVGTALANQANLGNGETWKFKAHALTEFRKYRIDKNHGLLKNC
jgi:hypothetical protein